jgi:Uncharacterised protein family (UPF0175)
MTIFVEVPDAVARQLHLDGPQGGLRALEMFAIAGYRSGQLSRGQVGQLLDLSLWETETFLKRHDCGLGLTFEECERDIADAREFLAR